MNDFLRLVLTTVSSNQIESNSDPSSNKDLESFITLLLHGIGTLPLNNPTHLPVDCKTIQLLADLRFTINDAALSEKFFVHLMYSADFWINTQNIELINEFWSFVKAIYSQNPVAYNKAFPIQYLIDFMLRICESSKSDPIT